MSTFGLISENKSIETVLYALPEIVQKHPEVLYMVIGKTHPEIIKKEGEKYRNSLLEIVDNLHLENNVVFINEYLELKQLLGIPNLVRNLFIFVQRSKSGGERHLCLRIKLWLCRYFNPNSARHRSF
jgi:glycosyltransferase involved in cell wall biosynthesis